MDEDNLELNKMAKPEKQKHKKSRSCSGRPASHGNLKKRRTTTSNIFTASFTRNVKSNNASLAKQVAVLKQQLHQMAEDKKQLTCSNIEDRMRHSNETILYAEHINRIKEYVQQSIHDLDAHIMTLGKVQREIMLLNNLAASMDTGSTARYYKDDHNRGSGGSKTTQTVNPMVSGLTITQPTISLSRVDNLNLVAAAAARRAAINFSPSMTAIAETDTPTAVQDSDSDEEVDVSLLSRSNRARVQARPMNSPSPAELQAAFYHRVRSENGLEGTSGLARRRRMPRRFRPTPAAAATSSDDDDTNDRTSLVPIDMDETDVLNLSPIVRQPCDMAVPGGGNEASPAHGVPLVPCSVNMSAGNALETVTGAGVVYATAAVRSVSIVASKPDQGPRVSVVPCTVNMSAGNALETARASVAGTTAAKSASSVASKFNHVPSANFSTCTVNMSAGNALDLPKVSAVVATSAVKSAPKPNHTPSATLPSCTVNMSAGNALDPAKTSAVKSASAVATKTDHNAGPPPASCSANVSAVDAPVAVPSSVAISTSGVPSKFDHTPNVPVAQCTVNMSAGNALGPAKPTSPSKFPSSALDRLRACVARDLNDASAVASADAKTSARATGSAEAESASGRTEEPTEAVSGPSSNGTAVGCGSTGKPTCHARTKNKISKSATGTRSKIVLPTESCRSEPLKRLVLGRAKEAAGGGVENGAGSVLYEETPTRGTKMNAAGSAVNLLNVESKEDNKEMIRRRALRNIEPTNYKEPSLNKKMRRGEDYS